MTAPREKQLFPTFDPEQTYSYVWPGCQPRMVKGSELTALCRGANADLLDIKLVNEVPLLIVTAPPVAAPFEVEEVFTVSFEPDDDKEPGLKKSR